MTWRDWVALAWAVAIMAAYLHSLALGFAG